MEGSNGTSVDTRRQILPVANATKPYWRSELHPIDEHRSTAELPSECDIAIIGAGMSGVSTAYHLLKAVKGKQAPSIVMLEARQVCSGATGRNGGHSKVKVDTLMESLKSQDFESVMEVVDLIREQAYAMKQAVEDEKLDCEFELRRTFDVFLEESEAERNKLEFAKCLKAGQRWTRDISLVEKKYAEQATSLQDARLAFNGPGCSLWPYKFVTTLLARLIDQDAVNLQTHTPVTEVTQSNGINVLKTPRGNLKAKKVVFATNAYTAGILPSYEGEIVPYKGTATHITPKVPVSPHLSNTYNIHYPAPSNENERVDYMNPRPDGGIVVGGGNWCYRHKKSDWDNNWDDSVILEEARPHFETLMQRHFKGWADSGARMDTIWTGIMGRTSNGRPHIGEVPGSAGSRYIIAGFNGGGMSMIFLSSKGLARMIAEGVPFEDVGLPRLFKTTKDRLSKTNRS